MVYSLRDGRLSGEVFFGSKGKILPDNESEENQGGRLLQILWLLEMNPKSVLIVDDDKNIRLTLAMAMEPLDFAVEMVANGEEALKKLAQKSFSLLLLDMRLPGLDGLEILRRVVRTWPQIKVIVITAYGSADMAVEAMSLGAVDFLAKPFNPDDVRRIVTHILHQETIDQDNLF